MNAPLVSVSALFAQVCLYVGSKHSIKINGKNDIIRLQKHLGG